MDNNDKKTKAMAKRPSAMDMMTPRERSELLDKRINEKGEARVSKTLAASSAAVFRKPAVRRSGSEDTDSVAKARARSSNGGAYQAAAPISSAPSDRVARDVAKNGMSDVRSGIADRYKPTNRKLSQLEDDIAAKSKPQVNQVLVSARSRGNPKPVILPYSSELEERIAQKTGIFMNEDEKSKSSSLNSTPGAVHGVNLDERIANKTGISIESKPGATNGIPLDDSSSTKRPGIAHCTDLDERIAYKTGIPLDGTQGKGEKRPDKHMDKKSIAGGSSSTKIRSEKEIALEKFKATLHDDIDLENTFDGGRGYYTDGTNIYGDDLNDEAGRLAVATAVKEAEDDAFIPAAVEYDPDAKPPMYRNRRFRLYGLLACSVLVLVVATTIGLLSSGREVIVYTEEPSQAPTSIRKGLGIQEQLELVVGYEKLNDPKSPHHKALNWIVNDDTMQLQPDDVNLVQRFLLATFYFATHEEDDWLSCNAPVEGEDQFCFFKKLEMVEPAVYRDVPWVRWLSEPHECLWAGVFCDELDQVRTIELQGQMISSMLPVELAYLPFLQGINLSWNYLEGPIPAEYGDMKYLLTLELHYNSLTGTVPGDWPNAKNLQLLNLGNNELTGTIPQDISSLQGLKGLYLYGNFLTGGLPTNLDTVESLVYLRLQGNFLTGTIPSNLGNIPSLREIWLQRMPISGTIPSELGNISNLNDLRALKTNLEGTIPEELWKLNNLQRVDLYSNRLTGTLSPSVSRLDGLRTLRLQSNELTGQIPLGLGMLTNLQRLRLENNRFSGTVPSALCELRGPETLYQLFADCLDFTADDKAVHCECCDYCCNKDLGECAAQD